MMTSLVSDANPTAPHITLFYDGGCPVCKREAALMRRKDKGRCRLAFIDIDDPAFNPDDYGRTLDEFMAAMHGQLPDGRMLTGVAVFREAYRAIGLGWLLAWTAWPGLRWCADRAYAIFARYRDRSGSPRNKCRNGRCDLPTIPEDIPAENRKNSAAAATKS